MRCRVELGRRLPGETALLGSPYALKISRIIFLEIYISQVFSSYATQNSRKKSGVFFPRVFLGFTLQKKIVKLISRFFSRFSFLEFFLLSFTYKKSRDVFYVQNFSSFSLNQKIRYTHHYARSATMNVWVIDFGSSYSPRCLPKTKLYCDLLLSLLRWLRTNKSLLHLWKETPIR